RLAAIGHVAHHHAVHARLCRPLVCPVDECLHGLRGAPGTGLHPAVVAVAYPAAYAQAFGRLHHGPAVAHALDFALDEEVAGDGSGGIGVHGGTVLRAPASLPPGAPDAHRT